MKIAISSFLRIALAALGLFFSWPVVAFAEGKPAAGSITFDQVGAEAQKQYKGGAIGVVVAGDGMSFENFERPTKMNLAEVFPFKLERFRTAAITLRHFRSFDFCSRELPNRV